MGSTRGRVLCPLSLCHTGCGLWQVRWQRARRSPCSAQAQRLQAATAGLHEDVLLAEARLRRIRAVHDVSGAAEGERPQQSAWVRRALARTASATDEDEALGSPAAEARRPRAVRASG